MAEHWGSVSFITKDDITTIRISSYAPTSDNAIKTDSRYAQGMEVESLEMAIDEHVEALKKAGYLVSGYSR